MTKQDVYYVISTDDKGLAIITKLSLKGVEKLIKELEEDYQGDLEGEFLDVVDKLDLAYCDHKYVIIKGEVIIPKPITKVTKYSI